MVRDTRSHAFTREQRLGVYRAIYERRDVRSQFPTKPLPSGGVFPLKRYHRLFLLSSFEKVTAQADPFPPALPALIEPRDYLVLFQENHRYLQRAGFLAERQSCCASEAT